MVAFARGFSGTGLPPLGPPENRRSQQQCRREDNPPDCGPPAGRTHRFLPPAASRLSDVRQRNVPSQLSEFVGHPHAASGNHRSGQTLAIIGTLPVDPSCGDLDINCYDQEQKLQAGTLSVAVGISDPPRPDDLLDLPLQATDTRQPSAGYQQRPRSRRQLLRGRPVARLDDRNADFAQPGDHGRSSIRGPEPTRCAHRWRR